MAKCILSIPHPITKLAMNFCGEVGMFFAVISVLVFLAKASCTFGGLDYFRSIGTLIGV